MNTCLAILWCIVRYILKHKEIRAFENIYALKNILTAAQLYFFETTMLLHNWGRVAECVAEIRWIVIGTWRKSIMSGTTFQRWSFGRGNCINARSQQYSCITVRLRKSQYKLDWRVDDFHRTWFLQWLYCKSIAGVVAAGHLFGVRWSANTIVTKASSHISGVLMVML